MKTKTGIALIFLVLALSLATAAIIQQNSQAPAWTLIPTAATLQQPTPKSITVTWGIETQANTYTASDQSFPSVCCRSDGSFVVAWASFDQDSSGYGVYAKIFNSTGQNLTGDIQVNTYTTNNQTNPSVCCRSDGSFVVVWDGEGTGDSFGVYAKLFNSAGVALTGDIQVNTYTANNQWEPSVCCRSDSSFVVAWTSDVQDSSGPGVYAKIFNSAGSSTTGDILVNTYTGGTQWMPSVCCRSDSSFVVTWSSKGQDSSFYGVFAKIFDSTGSSTTGDIQVNTYTTNDQTNPSVCCRSDGSFVVAWESDGQDLSGFGVFAKIFDSTGSSTTGDIQVNTYTTNDQTNPSVCCRSDDSFVIAWHSDGQDLSGNGVYAKIFNSAGVSTTGDIRVNTYTTNDQRNPSVRCRSDGSFVVAWMSYGQDAAGTFGVYFRVGSPAALPVAVFSLVAVLSLMQSASGVSLPLLVGGGLVAAVVVGVLGFWLWKRRT